jgi:hypothetical protein
LDSLAFFADTAKNLKMSKRVDSSKHNDNYGSNTVVVKSMSGEILKIQELSTNGCSNYAYYFKQSKIYKVTVKVNCSGNPLWDTTFYFENDKTIAQVDKGTPLYGEAFRQSAYNSLKDVLR